MGTTTHKITLPAGEYTNVSNGNLSCVVFVRYNQRLKAHIGGTAPLPDSEEWFDIGGVFDSHSGDRLGLRVGNLTAETDVFVCPFDEYEDTVIVVRGDITF